MRWHTDRRFNTLAAETHDTVMEGEKGDGLAKVVYPAYPECARIEQLLINAEASNEKCCYVLEATTFPSCQNGIMPSCEKNSGLISAAEATALPLDPDCPSNVRAKA